MPSALAGFEMMEEYEGSGDKRVFVGYAKKVNLVDRKAAVDMAMRHVGKHNKYEAVPLRARLDRMRRSAPPAFATALADGPWLEPLGYANARAIDSCQAILAT
jgi:hypothetical protein